MASRLGGWGFKESSAAEISDDKGHRHQGDADPHGRKQLVDGIGHHERAGACCQFGLHQRLFEANLKQDCRHVYATGGERWGVGVGRERDKENITAGIKGRS